MTRHYLAIAVACSLTTLLAASQSVQRVPSPAYDGHWWLSTGSEERAGFVNGYRDCYEYEFRGPDRFSYGTTTYSTAITDFYQQGAASQRAISVAEVFRKFTDTAGLKLTVPGAQEPKLPHGGKDGLYWMQLSVAGPGGQIGFIEGFLACHAGPNNNKGGTFPRPAAEYVKSISNWYRFNSETGDIDAKRQPAFIADVLFRFRGQTSAGR